MIFNWGRKEKGPRGEPLPERNDGPPDSGRPSGLCPRCEKQSSFEILGSVPLTFDGGHIVNPHGPTTPTYSERSTVLFCRHCKQGVAVLEEEWVGDHPKREGLKGGGTISWRGFHWWPPVGIALHSVVPEQIREAFHEAALALGANCPRASAVMARRTLEAIAADRGEVSGTLAEKLKRLSLAGVLHPTLADWSTEVRLVGNAGAHFDPMEKVTVEDARQLIEFIRELAKYIYVLPHELSTRRQPPPNPPRKA
jgi:hypothetical protein